MQIVYLVLYIKPKTDMDYFCCLRYLIKCLKCDVVQFYCEDFALYANVLKDEVMGHTHICYRYKRPLFNY